MIEHQSHRTVGVRVGVVQIGGDAPIAVQSMTMTDTASVPSHECSGASAMRCSSSIEIIGALR